MLENDFTPANRHPKMDASQINEHLDNMSIDELTDVLTDMWDATDDLSYSTDWMDECEDNKKMHSYRNYSFFYVYFIDRM
ncbi:hypothetical protein EGP95_02485 [bacterium]|nr:hypothetical protein [bacterium]